MAAVHTGWAVKRGAIKKSWKRRYFQLFPDMNLVYYKDVASAAQSKPQGSLNLTGGGVAFHNSRDEATVKLQWPQASAADARFAISTKDRKLYLYCDTAHEADAFLAALQQVTGMVPAPQQPMSIERANDEVDDSMDAAAAEKRKERLGRLLQLSGNKQCCDCGVKAPKWAAWNHGAFLCLTCAGVHRGLGTHISKVRSVNLDSWSIEQVAAMENGGNDKCRARLESALPPDFVRPTEGAALQSFIRDKYVAKKFAGSGGTSGANAPTPTPALPNPFFADFSVLEEPGSNKANEVPGLSTNAAGFADFDAYNEIERDEVNQAIQSDPMAQHQWF